MSKCIWKNGGACCQYWISGNCNQVDSFNCEHKAAPVPCPVCPVCGKALHHAGNWLCQTVGCGYSQPDSAQRPKRPEPVAGSHWEWRRPNQGELYFSTNMGCVLTCGKEEGEPEYPCYWIAVPDAVPAFTETAVGEFQPVPDRRIGGVDLRAGMRKKPAPEPVPVVLETTFVCPRCNNEMMQDYEVCGDPWVCGKCDFPWGKAAKSPAAKVIEPLDPMCGTLERTEKINELVAWINAKGAV